MHMGPYSGWRPTLERTEQAKIGATKIKKAKIQTKTARILNTELDFFGG
jgi:hypothetical protein